MSLGARDRRQRMPKTEDVHRYWTLERPDDAAEWFGQHDPAAPSCYACGWAPMTRSFTGFERGHLVDHALGGSSDAHNLVLLCSSCNGTMPMFEPGQEDEAIAWVRYQPSWLPIGLAKARAAVRYVDEHGDLPPWIRRGLDGSPAARDLEAALTRYLAHRAGKAGELFPESPAPA